jgi:hypothetical protein
VLRADNELDGSRGEDAWIAAQPSGNTAGEAAAKPQADAPMAKIATSVLINIQERWSGIRASCQARQSESYSYS